MVGEAECIDALQRAADELDDSPTKAAYDDLGLTPASATIQRVMGSWNAAKDAADLETYTSTGSRTHPKPDDLELPDDVDWESLSADQRWHYKNREWNAERSLRRRECLNRWLADYKLEHGGCNRCEADDPRAVDFHHVDAETKTLAVNEMVTMGYSKEAIRDEVEQCDLLCANCHAREHIDPVDDAEQSTKAQRLRAWTRTYKREHGCRRCDAEDPRCLQFHHVDEKRATVSSLISDSASVATVREEVDRCTVLCANCHRMEHRREAVESDSI